MPNAPKPHRTREPTPTRDYRQHTAAERGYDGWWRAHKDRALQQMNADEYDFLCRYCRRVNATMLDHAIPPQGPVGSIEYTRQFRDQRYWIPCCVPCNSRKRDMMPDELRQRQPTMWQRMVTVLAVRGCDVSEAAIGR